MALEDTLKAQVRAALLTAAIELTVDALAQRFLVKMHPFPSSEQISIDNAANLQPRGPDVKIGNMPHWGGVTEPNFEGELS